jgi:hypothetical protein
VQSDSEAEEQIERVVEALFALDDLEFVCSHMTTRYLMDSRQGAVGDPLKDCENSIREALERDPAREELAIQINSITLAGETAMVDIVRHESLGAVKLHLLLQDETWLVDDIDME